MTKLIVFWLIGMASILILGGGGIWFAFWCYAKAKKNKMF